MLTAMRSVLDLKKPPVVTYKGQRVKFTSPAEEGYDNGRSVTFSVEDWIELGRPLQVTILIEPGDSLNP